MSGFAHLERCRARESSVSSISGRSGFFAYLLGAVARAGFFLGYGSWSPSERSRPGFFAAFASTFCAAPAFLAGAPQPYARDALWAFLQERCAPRLRHAATVRASLAAFFAALLGCLQGQLRRRACASEPHSSASEASFALRADPSASIWPFGMSISAALIVHGLAIAPASAL
jgi:hypothetical protein